LKLKLEIYKFGIISKTATTSAIGFIVTIALLRLSLQLIRIQHSLKNNE